MKILLTYKFDRYYSFNYALNNHWSVNSKIKKQIQSDVYYLLIGKLQHINTDKDYYYTFYFEYFIKNKNMDSDNTAYMRKCIMDAIKQTKLIKDDNIMNCKILDKNASISNENKICVYFTRKIKDVANNKEKQLKTTKLHYPKH